MKLIVTFLILITTVQVAAVYFCRQDIDKYEARLEKLEAASTTAQQPQERHYPGCTTSGCDEMVRIALELDSVNARLKGK